MVIGHWSEGSLGVCHSQCSLLYVFHLILSVPQVYLSTRSGAWVVGRVGAGGLPCDVVSGARLAVLMHRLMPTRTTRAVERLLNAHFDHRLYGLQPSHGYDRTKG